MTTTSSPAWLAEALATPPAGDGAAALVALRDQRPPSRRDENWRYFDHRWLERSRFTPAPAANLSTAHVAAVTPPGLACTTLVFANGRHVAALSDALPKGVTLAPLTANPSPGADVDAWFGTLAAATAPESLELRIAGNIDQPIRLLWISDVSEVATVPARLAVDVAAGASVHLVHQHATTRNVRSLTNLVQTLTVGDGATCRVARVIEGGADDGLILTGEARIGRDARLLEHHIVLSGRLVRAGLGITLAGPGAHYDLAGLALLDGQRVADLHTRVTHAAPRATSVQVLRAVAADASRGAYNGQVIVNPGADGTDARQSSRNLLLTPGAELCSRPQLEIYADDVKCSHGATTGSLDPAQLFYLRSRGLDATTAQQLLTYAFCAEVIAGLAPSALYDAVNARLGSRLPGAPTPKDLT